MTTNLFRLPPVVYVPRKGRQFHGKDHLRASDFDCFVTQAKDYPNNMTTGSSEHGLQMQDMTDILDSEMAHDETIVLLVLTHIKAQQIDLHEDDPWHAGTSEICSNEVRPKNTAKELKEAPL